jgi:hypothetical protein
LIARRDGWEMAARLGEHKSNLPAPELHREEIPLEMQLVNFK